MPTPSRKKGLLVFSALAAASFGNAQMRSNPVPPNPDPVREAIQRSSSMTVKAWGCLRDGNLREAEMLAKEAIRICKEASYVCPEGHEVIADAHLLRGEPGLALAEINDEAKEGSEGLLSVWPIYTKAIALAQLGRKAEARTILVDAAGDAEGKGGHKSALRSRLFRWRLPMDGDDSVGSLVATGYLLRADFHKTQNRPEALEDLQTALTLSPQLPVAHWMLSQRLKDEGRLVEALAEANRVGPLGDPKAAAFLASHLASLKWQIEARDKAKNGG